MSTVGEAIRLMNEKHCHPTHHITMIRTELIPEEMVSINTPHTLMKQTFDWRYDFTKKDAKEKYTVTLTKQDIEFLGNAIELYNQASFEYHIKPILERMVDNAVGEVRE